MPADVLRQPLVSRTMLHEGAHVAAGEILGLHVIGVNVDLDTGQAQTVFAPGWVSHYTLMCTALAPMILYDLGLKDMEKVLGWQAESIGQYKIRGATEDAAKAHALMNFTEAKQFVEVYSISILQRAGAIAKTLHAGWNTPDQWAVKPSLGQRIRQIFRRARRTA